MFIPLSRSTSRLIILPFSVNYKPRMVKILADMAIVSEVAELASESENLVAAAEDNNESINTAIAKKQDEGLLTSRPWEKIQQTDELSAEEDHSGQLPSTRHDETVAASNVAEVAPADELEFTEGTGIESLTSSDEDDVNNGSDEDSESDENNEADAGSTTSGEAAAVQNAKKIRHVSSIASLSRRDKCFKNLLDRWDEPENISDKVSDCRR